MFNVPSLVDPIILIPNPRLSQHYLNFSSEIDHTFQVLMLLNINLILCLIHNLCYQPRKGNFVKKYEEYVQYRHDQY